MSIAFDYASQEGDAGPLSLEWAHTCSGSDRILIVGIVVSSGTQDPEHVEYNGVQLTKLADSYNADTPIDVVRLYYMVNPDVGTHNIHVYNAVQAFTDLMCTAVSYTGVHQTTPFGTAAINRSHGTSSTPTVNVSSAAGELVIDTMGMMYSGTPSPTTGQTLRAQHYEDNPGTHWANASEKAGDTTVTMSWDQSSTYWTTIGVSLKPAGGGGGATVKQEGFRFRNDDGYESSTQIVIASPNILRRLNTAVLRTPLSIERVQLNPYHPLNFGLRSWWLANEGVGDILYDIVSGKHMSMTGTVPRAYIDRQTIGPSATTDYYSRTDGDITTEPISMVGWFYVLNITAGQAIIALCPNSAFIGFFLVFRANAAGNPVGAMKDNTATGLALSLTGPDETTGLYQWYHGAAVFESATSRYAYFNGVPGNQETTNVTSPTVAFQSIGVAKKSTVTNANLGYVSNVGLWTRILSHFEVRETYLHPFGTLDEPRLLPRNPITYFIPSGSPVASFKGDEDADVSIGVDTKVRIRMILDAANAAGSKSLQLEYKKSTDSVWTKVV